MQRQLFIEEGGTEGERKGDLQLDQIEDDHEEQAPEESKLGEGVDVEPAIVIMFVLLEFREETLLVE